MSDATTRRLERAIATGEVEPEALLWHLAQQGATLGVGRCLYGERYSVARQVERLQRWRTIRAGA
mgnify:CR=1 FL=1